MEISLRILLFAGSILTFAFISKYIKKSRVRIEDTLFWVIFSCILMIAGIFPGGVIWISKFLKIESPANLVFLVVIFVLMVHQFFMSMKMSQMEIKFRELVQLIAIKNTEDK
ncbi:MAG: DUF2304 domain-containing protein [Oscillospiraceae bacterium]|nr:DUF2304 domain-containing protein [Oscillospiraceae bacterium]